MTEENQNPLIQITVPNANIQQSTRFEEVLAQIPELNKESEAIQATDIKKLDEDQITQLNKKMRVVSGYKRDMNAVRKAIKDSYNKPRDMVLNWFDSKLSAAGFDELETNINKNKQLSRDVLANRANERWQELEATFNATLEAYPLIKEMAPQLADFTQFRVRHPKLVSGAKNKKITDKVRGEVANEIAAYNNGLQDIKANAAKLAPSYQTTLLQAFADNPTSETILTQTRYLVDRQNADIKAREALKKQQEEAAKRQQTQSAQAQSTSQTTAPTQPTPKLQPTQQGPDYTWLIQYIQTMPNGNKIHNNNRVKANVLYNLYNNISNRNSIWYKKVGTDADNVIAITKYIISL